MGLKSSTDVGCESTSVSNEIVRLLLWLIQVAVGVFFYTHISEAPVLLKKQGDLCCWPSETAERERGL